MIPPHSQGTTSACAENTDCKNRKAGGYRNYLRVRGEYSRHGPAGNPNQELPPRARRIRRHYSRPRYRNGTTSACAENTLIEIFPPPMNGNYLRVRGEYFFHNKIPPNTWELPPRARRIPGTGGSLAAPQGTTSACAENTPNPWWGAHDRGNYLRVRGEYWRKTLSYLFLVELPPRARRILYSTHGRMQMTGTTSAHAENTRGQYSGIIFLGNYLRVRGEYPILGLLGHLVRELPPRARRIPIVANHCGLGGGTTSACAENTVGAFFLPTILGNYLRVRGEYIYRLSRC